MPFFNAELNRLADYSTDEDLTLYACTAAPSEASPNNGRLATPTVALDDANWSDAELGDVMYNADAEFGVLDSANQRVITHWKIQRGTANVVWGAMENAVTVTAGGTFKINSGTIRLNGGST